MKVGMVMTAGTLTRWHVADGAGVAEGEPLYELETEKVSMDVPSPASGTVRHLIPSGTTVTPASRVGWIYAPGEQEVDDEAPPRPDNALSVAAPAENRRTGDEGRGAAATPRPASPFARRLAREYELDLNEIAGSGPGGRIVEADVEEARERAAALSSSLPESASTPGEVELSPMRRKIAQRMHESLQRSAQLTMNMTTVMDEVIRLRDAVRDESPTAEDTRISVTAIAVKAVAHALRVHPTMNSHLLDGGLLIHSEINIGLAVALDEGLVVPVIRHADTLSLREIVQEIDQLAGMARRRELASDRLDGSTFTVSTLGAQLVDSFTPILNPPETGILGLTRVRQGIVWVDDVPTPRWEMTLCLTWDHRVVDGVPAANFLTSVRGFLEQPALLI